MINTIDLPRWWSNGNGMSIRRTALSPCHPEYPFNYVKRTYPGADPRDFGIYPAKCYCDLCRVKRLDDIYEKRRLEAEIHGY